MSKAPRNSSKFGDVVSDHYAKGEHRKSRLQKESEREVSWLRKKFSNDKRAQALADKLDNCTAKSRSRDE